MSLDIRCPLDVAEDLLSTLVALTHGNPAKVFLCF